MPTQTTIPFSEGIFSITFTAVRWLPLIEKVHGYDIVYHWFDHLKTKGHYILGYVIMPNHVHVMIAFRQSGQSINTIIGNGKRFMAYSIVERLRQMGEVATLALLSNEVEPERRGRKKLHAVWEISFDWKKCNTEEFIWQKLHYYHINPCKGKWQLSNSPVEYIHSSAQYYATGQQGEYEVTSFRTFDDIGLIKGNE